jgi:hypothetical protein
VNAILLVEGGLQNTHYAAHERYLQELVKLRKAHAGGASQEVAEEAYPIPESAY